MHVSIPDGLVPRAAFSHSLRAVLFRFGSQFCQLLLQWNNGKVVASDEMWVVRLTARSHTHTGTHIHRHTHTRTHLCFQQPLLLEPCYLRVRSVGVRLRFVAIAITIGAFTSTSCVTSAGRITIGSGARLKDLDGFLQRSNFLSQRLNTGLARGSHIVASSARTTTVNTLKISSSRSFRVGWTETVSSPHIPPLVHGTSPAAPHFRAEVSEAPWLASHSCPSLPTQATAVAYPCSS